MINNKITIITINYNNLNGLKNTVSSVVNQTWREFEYVVIDGGSTDGSAEFIKSQSEFIDYWISEPDNGIYNAMNKGIVKSTGEYLLFLNSGDHFFDIETLSKCNIYLDSHDLVTFDIKMIEDEKNRIVSYPDKFRFSNLFNNGLCHQSTFIKRKLFDSVGLYDENLKFVSDWKFFILALFKNQCSYFKANEILAVFYLDGVSSDLTNKKMLMSEKKQVLEEYFTAFVLDYEELLINREIVNTNRHKILIEIENTRFGKKIMSLFLSTCAILFTKRMLKNKNKPEL